MPRHNASFAPGLPDFRMAIGLKRAGRATREFPVPKASNAASKLGLRYENRVAKELLRHEQRGNFTRVEHNPWFTFSDIYGTANCCPDFLLWSEAGLTIVEVKLTWVEVAIHKLNDLYTPVVSMALEQSTMPLVICRNSAPGAPKAEFTLGAAMASPYRLLQWPDTGHMLW